MGASSSSSGGTSGKKQRPWKVLLEIGSKLKIPIDGYKTVEETNPKPFKNVSAKDPTAEITRVQSISVKQDKMQSETDNDNVDGSSETTQEVVAACSSVKSSGQLLSEALDTSVGTELGEILPGIDSEESMVADEIAEIKEPEPMRVKEQIVKGYWYGTKAVPFSKEDKERFKFQSDKEMKVLGFTAMNNIKRQHFLGTSTMAFTARAGDETAAVTLSAFINAMNDEKLCAIVRRVYAKNSNAKIGCLVPEINSEYECLYYNELPFCEDIRHHKFESLPIIEASVSNKKHLPKDDLVDLMDQLITDMDLSKADVDESGTESEALRPEVTPHPYTERLNQCLHYRSFFPNERLPERYQMPESLEPPELLIDKSEATVQKLKKVFKPIQEIRTAETWMGRRDQGASSNKAGDGGIRRRKRATDLTALVNRARSRLTVVYGSSDEEDSGKKPKPDDKPKVELGSSYKKIPESVEQETRVFASYLSSDVDASRDQKLGEIYTKPTQNYLQNVQTPTDQLQKRDDKVRCSVSDSGYGSIPEPAANEGSVLSSDIIAFGDLPKLGEIYTKPTQDYLQNVQTPADQLKKLENEHACSLHESFFRPSVSSDLTLSPLNDNYTKPTQDYLQNDQTSTSQPKKLDDEDTCSESYSIIPESAKKEDLSQLGRNYTEPINLQNVKYAANQLKKHGNYSQLFANYTKPTQDYLQNARTRTDQMKLDDENKFSPSKSEKPEVECIIVSSDDSSDNSESLLPQNAGERETLRTEQNVSPFLSQELSMPNKKITDGLEICDILMDIDDGGFPEWLNGYEYSYRTKIMTLNVELDRDRDFEAEAEFLKSYNIDPSAVRFVPCTVTEHSGSPGLLLSNKIKPGSPLFCVMKEECKTFENGEMEVVDMCTIAAFMCDNAGSIYIVTCMHEFQKLLPVNKKYNPIDFDGLVLYTMYLSQGKRVPVKLEHSGAWGLYGSFKIDGRGRKRGADICVIKLRWSLNELHKYPHEMHTECSEICPEKEEDLDGRDVMKRGAKTLDTCGVYDHVNVGHPGKKGINLWLLHKVIPFTSSFHAGETTYAVPGDSGSLIVCKSKENKLQYKYAFGIHCWEKPLYDTANNFLGNCYLCPDFEHCIKLISQTFGVSLTRFLVSAGPGHQKGGITGYKRGLGVETFHDNAKVPKQNLIQTESSYNKYWTTPIENETNHRAMGDNSFNNNGQGDRAECPMECGSGDAQSMFHYGDEDGMEKVASASI